MALKTITQVLTAEHVISEGNGRRSREQIVLAITAVDLPAGTVLGKVTASGQYAPLAPAATDGTQTAAAILFSSHQANTATQRAVAHVRDSEVNGWKLNYVNAVNATQKTAAETALANAGVLVRY